MTTYDTYRSSAEITVPATMQAVVACGRGFENLAVRDVPVPRPGPHQLLARVDAAGVCTSILKLIDQGPDHTYINGWDMERWPVILGDEGAVTIVQAGSNLADRYRPGERYAIQPAVDVAPILHRERYRNHAEGMRKCAVGYTLPGHLAQYILIQEEVLEAGCLLPLPDAGLPYFAVSMGEPISCIYSAQDRNYHIRKDGPFAPRQPVLGLQSGGTTVVVGAGAMGRIHAELALRFRPATLIVSDLQQERLDRTTHTLGAKAAARGVRLVCVQPDALEKTVRDASDGRGADDVILAVGVRPVQQQALTLLAKGGVANLFGGLPKGQHMLEVSALAVHYDEIKLVGSSGGEPSDMAATLTAIADGDVDPGNYVAAVGSLDNAIHCLELIKQTRLDGKAILYPHVQPTPLRMVEHWSAETEAAFLTERM
jgi:threonine dehydrogenase-like Zn-dependent dehydrogenase